MPGRAVSAKALAAPAATSSRCCKRWCAMASWRGIRGPHGGYELGRERNRITADDILRAATTVDEVDAFPPNSALVNEIVWPALAETERTVSVALGRMTWSDVPPPQRNNIQPCRAGTCSRSGLFRRDSP